MRAFIALAGSVLVVVPALAQAPPPQTANKDGATALTVAPPLGYVTEVLPPRNGQVARFGIKLPADKDTGCQVAFTPAPQNGKLTQAELDATMRGRQWQDMARSALAAAYEVGDAAVVEGKGGPFYAVSGDFKDRPGLPPRAREVRTLFVIRETPRGRTSTVCVGDKADFEKRRTDFTAVAAGAKAP